MCVVVGWGGGEREGREGGRNFFCDLLGGGVGNN